MGTILQRILTREVVPLSKMIRAARASSRKLSSESDRVTKQLDSTINALQGRIKTLRGQRRDLFAIEADAKTILTREIAAQQEKLNRATQQKRKKRADASSAVEELERL